MFPEIKIGRYIWKGKKRGGGVSGPLSRNNRHGLPPLTVYELAVYNNGINFEKLLFYLMFQGAYASNILLP